MPTPPYDPEMYNPIHEQNLKVAPNVGAGNETGEKPAHEVPEEEEEPMEVDPEEEQEPLEEDPEEEDLEEEDEKEPTEENEAKEDPQENHAAEVEPPVDDYEDDLVMY
ncbi:hypothetical protein Droror1_Dr00023510 [Drosera rotundifolia]